MPRELNSAILKLVIIGRPTASVLEIIIKIVKITSVIRVIFINCGFFTKLYTIANKTMSREIRNCCRVKTPKNMVTQVKIKVFLLNPDLISFKDKNKTRVNNRLVNGSGKMPVDEKTSMGLKAIREVRVICNTWLFSKIIFPIL